jgi:outer membrane usher protein FimD/PapC
MTLDQFEWIYTLPTSELAVGDWVFGVSELTFPILRMTGVRFSGVSGMFADASRGRAPGMGNSFGQPQIFEGSAANGSRVELILNDNLIQAQTVLLGTFRFDDVRLAPGTLNNVRIRITEPSGLERIVERNIFGK